MEKINFCEFFMGTTIKRMDELMDSMSFVLLFFFLGVYWSEWLKFDFSFVCLSLFHFVYLKYFNLFAYHIFDLVCYVLFKQFGSDPWNCRNQKIKTQSQQNIFVDFLSFIFFGVSQCIPYESIYIEGFKVNSFSCHIFAWYFSLFFCCCFCSFLVSQ